MLLMIFYLFIFQCGVFSCLSSSWHGLVIHFARELLAPSWCCACFVVRFLYTCFVLPAREGNAALHVVWMFLLLPILSENGFGLLDLSAWHPIRWRLTNISLKPLHVVFFQLYFVCSYESLGWWILLLCACKYLIK